MKTKTDRTGLDFLIVGLAAWVGLCCAVSCSSSDQVPAGGRVAHPDPTPASPSKSVEDTFLDNLLKSVPIEKEFIDKCSADERACNSNVSRTPIDEAIADDYPAREWSKNVPYLPCTRDDECGDGFCDRGQCAPIMTWNDLWGQRCKASHHCPGLLCINGRCRSCIADAECKSKYGHPDAMCDSPHPTRSPRYCNDLRIPPSCTPGLVLAVPMPAGAGVEPPVDAQRPKSYSCPWSGSRWPRLVDSIRSSPVFVPPPRPSERFARDLSPLDKTIADDCPTRAWSKNVPDRYCKIDGECGDGFCNRGRCEAIRTCDMWLGQRCEAERECDGLCIDGRCRSCESNAECQRKFKTLGAECSERGLGDRYCGFRLF